jgi:hypothetical protein
LGEPEGLKGRFDIRQPVGRSDLVQISRGQPVMAHQGDGIRQAGIEVRLWVGEIRHGGAHKTADCGMATVTLACWMS